MATPRKMIGIEYRAMTAEDVTEVRSLVERTIRSSYRRVYSPGAIEFFLNYHGEEDIRRDLRAGTSLVAVMAGRIVGTGTLRGDVITRVFVEPELQGRGIGGRLMRELLDHARAKGLKEVRLDASLVSRRVYERLGFEATAHRSQDLGDGDSLPYHEMVMRL